ncbi:HAMP domain-containing histidine kinase [Actinospica sp. MGRD01-02]|uniref:histidine kinase n=1 Tax=Actinospica acidithermotolerans TaxID=2828514 RepID=A0A941E4Q7_9ACTN|nr:HAMP domain-containing sensor histidine kinase [Actinospica acidithermotolerans]MBR7825091.1 HAMP domain-containing histidine kinase [Actinospica acidithermotolerans]
MTVRTRVTAVAGVALTAAVALGLVIMYLVQVGSAHRTADDELRTYAAQIEQSGQSGAWPSPLPASPLDARAQAQVLEGDGVHVLAATRALSGLPALYAQPAGAAAPVRQAGTGANLDGEVRVAGTRAVVDGHPVTIITLTTSDALNQINETFGRLLLVGVPVILLLACATVWLVVGRALRPVERIRRTVTEIGAADLSQRVPEPAARDEIGELARTMNGMLARLEDSATRQRRFVADASHELRTPLAAIRTALEVGLAHPDRAPWVQIAQRAARQSERLESLVQQLLLLARSDDRLLVQTPSRVAIEPLLRELRVSTPASGIRIEFREAAPQASDAASEASDAATEASDAASEAPDGATTAGSDVYVLGDPEQLERMVRNILDNAVRHARERVKLSIDTSVPGTVRIEIADDGPGIPAEERERVFGRFVRLDASRERGSGTTGLGLAIAQEIAAAHRGSIAIHEAPGGGALVRIDLPRAAD